MSFHSVRVRIFWLSPVCEDRASSVLRRRTILFCLITEVVFPLPDASSAQPQAMQLLLKYSFGPELYWVVICFAMKLVGQRNLPPTESGSRALEAYWWYLAFVFVPLAFLALFIPVPSRAWMLARIVVATFVGLIFAAYLVSHYIDYKDSRNSGVPTGWMMSVAFGWIVLMLGALVAGAVLWLRARHSS